jgi:colicin import membrane protein
MKIRTALGAVIIAMAGCAQSGPAPTVAVPPPAIKNLPYEASYAERIRAAILPYIAHVEPIEGNPVAEVRVTTRPDGEVVDAELVESSGYPSWDKSVRIAVLKAGRIPLDVDGKVPPVLLISFRPKL